jgi:tetratricopeptide (TPR) repeat protein/glutathione synthase/RimK-type ligase-like ATP-grasp enzyme
MNDFETAKQFFFEGLRLLEVNDFQGAEAKFAEALELMPDRVSTLNNLSATKIKLKKFAEAEKLARQAVAASDKSPEAWSNLGIALAATGRQEEALQACDRALSCNVGFPGAWLTKATTLLELKRYEEALQVCEQSLNIDPGKHEVLYTKGLILNELKRPDEARKMYRKALELRVGFSPVFVGERCATQKADVLIINPMPDFDSSLKSVDALYLSSPNFPGQLASHIHEDFHFTYVFADDASRPSARSRIPQPDFVMNNHANGELLVSEGSLSGLIELVDSFGVPVVNHPSKVVQTTRDVSVKLLRHIPGILVPKTIRFSSVGKTREALVHEIEDQYAYPLITRTLAFQRGKGMNKIDSRNALVEVLSAGCPEQFFVTEFVDSRGGSELFRKIRAAVVQDEIIIIRVDYSTDWNVHSRKARAAFYLENSYLLDEEKRICKDPEAGLGRSAIQALRAIRDRIPLEVFGIDFAVDVEGLVVFYEANATMNLFSADSKRVPNPKDAEDCLKLAFRRYFTSLVARR